MARSTFIPLHQFLLLDRACVPIVEAFDATPYLVGSSMHAPNWRDVDVRLILPDQQFDRMFESPSVWSVICLSMSEYLSRLSGLPVDFQIQRQTESESLTGERNPLGTDRRYAGGQPCGTPWQRNDDLARIDAALKECRVDASVVYGLHPSDYSAILDHMRNSMRVMDHDANGYLIYQGHSILPDAEVTCRGSYHVHGRLAWLRSGITSVPQNG